jgi:hypothetical protein
MKYLLKAKEMEINNKLDKITAIIIAIFGVIFFIITSFLFYKPSNKSCKKYIIKHANEIEKNKNYFIIPNYDGLYYNEITIRLNDDGYDVVYWGDRESFLWVFKLDKSFSVDTPYNKYKKYNTKLDEKILSLLKNI